MNRLAVSGLLILVALTVAPRAQVTSDRILRASEEPQNWITYSGNYSGQRHSLLTQITPANVIGLKEAWRFPMEAGGLESQPIKVGHTVYVITTTRTIAALDAATGAVKWTFDPGIAGTQPVRGLAVISFAGVSVRG